MSLNDEGQPLLEEFDHSRYAGSIIVLNLGLNFALYGFQNVMSTYLEQHLGLPAAAGPLTNTFAALSYVVALLSGMLADARWGLYKTILVGTAVFFLANVLLLIGNIVFLETGGMLPLTVLSFAGIALFVVGSGGTKACTSAFLGDQFGPSKAQQEKRSRFYSWYYLSIQFGSIGVSIGAPILLDQSPWGAWALFATLGGSFVLFVPIFLYGSRGFRKRLPQGSVYSTVFAIVGSALRRNRAAPRTAGVHWLEAAKFDHDAALVEDVKSVLRVLLVFAPLPFFWAIFFQMYSVWVAQACAMDRVIGGTAVNVTMAVAEAAAAATGVGCNSSAHVGGWTIPPATTITLNPLFDCFLIPLFASGLYPLLSRCVNVTPLRKMAAGHVFTIAALVTAGFVEVGMNAVPPGTVSVWWIVPQYFLVSVAEILLSVTVYELAYSQAPKSMKGLVTGCMFFTIALGNGLLACLQLIDGNRAVMNFAYAGAIGIVFGFFVWIAVRYEYRAEEKD